ncbi:MAG: MerR family transcriptional regulator [Acidimicrobiales bacterium]|nr:MerR family transcriptional regulator [Acidimicrobiales bacterium]
MVDVDLDDGHSLAGLTVDEVAAATGLGVDTVRYYQRLGLLDAPERHGRRAIYSNAHLARIAEIRRLADDGFTLAQIGTLGAEGPPTDVVDDLQRLANEALGRSLSRSEVARQAKVPEGLVALLVDNGLLAPIVSEPEQRFDEGAVSMVRAGLAISAAGVPLDELVALAIDHGAHVDKVVERAVELFDRHVRSDHEEADLLVEVVRSLLPAVTRLVAQHFHRTLVSRAHDQAGERDGGGLNLADALLAANADRLEVDVRWR